MGYKYSRQNKKYSLYNINAETLTERLRKVRALNCSPSDVGMDNYLCKNLFTNRVNSFIKV